MRQERLDLEAELTIAGTRVHHERGAFVRRARERGAQNCVDIFPAICHHFRRTLVRDESTLKLPREPQLGNPPVALYRLHRDAQHLCGLFDGQAAKESQLDDLALTRIDFAKASSARSTAITSTSGSGVMSGTFSSGTRCTPPPRFR